jgi:predicted nuclease of predicted toxin-antitoxin system
MLLYADENFPLRVVEELRRLGHDVLTALEDGKANQAISDMDLLRRATEINRVLLTLNRQDFKRLHFESSEHAGIVICTEDPDRHGQAERIYASIASAVDLHGKLLRVNRPSGGSAR